MNNAFVERKLKEARDELGLADRALDAVIRQGQVAGVNVEPLRMTAAHLREGGLRLDELRKELIAQSPAPVAMRACRHCGTMIRANATICSHCWGR
jgi:hypothetical protein